MDKHKKWFVLTLSGVLFLLTFFAIAVIIIDPLFQYHRPLSSLAYPINNQGYQNPGIVKNFDYDTLITGSSMTENFKTSWFEELMGLKAVKVPFAGAQIKNLNMITKTALEHNPKLKQIFWNLDLYALPVSVDKFREKSEALPYYLYDKNLLNDVNYLFNKDVLFLNIGELFLATVQGNKTTTFDEAYIWQDKFKFNENVVIKSVLEDWNQYKIMLPEVTELELEQTKDQLNEHIIPLIENYPQVQFDFFIPPYSILDWGMRLRTRSLETNIKMLEIVFSELLKYQNVKIHYFQNEVNIISNLYLYKDTGHYHMNVNRYIAESFTKGDHLLTSINYKQELDKTREIVETFNYDLFFGEIIPFKKESIVTRYLNKIGENQILLLASCNDQKIQVDPVTTQLLNELKIDVDMVKRASYIAIIDNGKVLLQTCNSNYIERKIDDLSIQIASEKEVGGGHFGTA